MRIERSNHPVFFFSKKEKIKIAQAIREAEKNTSGEIRVHLTGRASSDILRQAKEAFEQMGMSDTQNRNGVLLFFAVRSRQFALLGDSGICKNVPAGFWEGIIPSMEKSFSEDRFAEGVCDAVLKIGKELEKYFPYREGDRNELPDRISYSSQVTRISTAR